MVGPTKTTAPKSTDATRARRPEFGVPRKKEQPQHAAGSKEWFVENLKVRLDTDGFGEVARLLFDIKHVNGEWRSEITIVREYAEIILNVIADRDVDCGARKKAVMAMVTRLGDQQNKWIFDSLMRMTHDPALREIIHAALEGEVQFRIGMAKIDRQLWKQRCPDLEYQEEFQDVLDVDENDPNTKLNPALLRKGTALEALLASCELHASGKCEECASLTDC